MEIKDSHRRDRRATVFLCALCVLCGGVLAQDKTQTVQTPFGPAARRTTPAVAAPKKGPDPTLVRAEEKGDTVTFRRKTPFGDSVWTRKRAELTAFEKEILAAQPQPSKAK